MTLTTTTKSSIKATSGLAINEGRLLAAIHETAKFGAKGRWGTQETETGVCRLALSDLDKKVRDWFVEETSKLGCKIVIDKLGNIFAIYPGKKDGLPTAIGSHLDTQPTGGRYDGVLGVLTGLEVLRTFKENNFVPNYPVCVVNWTNEEGARFPVSMMSSSVWAGTHTLENIYNLKSVTDAEPVTVKQELERIQYMGDVDCSFEANPLAAHFELHIEQGPILEETNKKIGLVQGIQALRWFEVKVKGKAQHTGTTPLRSRSDALLAASKMVVRGNEIAHKHDGLCSVGIMELVPAVVNVIPEDVRYIVDMRNPDDTKLNKMFDEFQAAVKEITKESGVKLSFELKELLHQKAVHFDETCKKCIKDSATELYGADQTLPIVSGAGHDSGLTALKCPTAMIFIPSRDGVSHNPEEYSTPEQVHEGLEVMLNAVLKYDAQRTK
ncbi:hypothetical protein FT663_04117 [Candidozyma haemuli var. vulneris]|uniref:Peptidase M20 dimerisation domain-containing protein n=1 Tax=Candidozyma haemuli TaxID=45357 RepID=A0A2V1AWZ4_9ASCO|nr:hypothetical protein CXQ85_004933 [[Candida] haemuloni]KAF3986954.1 hypothetical protein FT662_04274 [[Candida] haemuloni var. vulneris]KAF3988232.1 hypothetical protein FT663_04117 [[Candida] haemuloni var. vulneris]PVH22365.1 hypothetical protein CXQ85_004933 [[Candida] haemuloni]